ncbi:UDP-N-acetylmuramoyl-L-alanyl-D-glutamate--2,6-diaminopimelate ligase [Halothiobacillus diazotrophicus]|uniref:UDP-N-acetylmuramoyl-L-alanyl-D-glutamate--2,6-diaminopimelate ligase n=1 Tax=Halothiobacillus diazotrophicus TaxID=1860122 RepID=A0A191ZJB9_9GAMM|nr:UDP-N-acetylmuramoyl-L-alanyl-D-glutamate--2,6-diaminopimelate ligase [Halothiobacillus diazotrophicus]ANJ67938.1 UDP-N-acetylmuramoyl-L-alanyl-D-glutamate--2,6-diaminopimelate ligase [Halothiobacillus diazotrophicus]
MSFLVLNRQTVASLLTAWGFPLTVSAEMAAQEVRALTDDSREVGPGVVFVARAGVHHQATDYIPMALERGAPLVLCEQPWADGRCVQVPNLTSQLWRLVSLGCGEDLSCLQIVGVTGTNGKTSVTHFIAGALKRSGAQHTAEIGVIGTLGAGLWSPGLDRLKPTGNTTPGLLEILAICVDFVRTGVRYVAMEVSSHALDQGRLDGVPITAAVFTNLSRDHLDYHGDMTRYFAAKAKLFMRPELKAAIVNFDSSVAEDLLEAMSGSAACWVYGLGDPDWRVADCQQVTVRHMVASPEGLRLTVQSPLGELSLATALIGAFNASNLLAALTTLLALGMPLEMAVSGLNQAEAPPGRMERFELPGAGHAIVDYAHTPDALDQVLRAVRDHRGDRGRTICVFGCGGERDRGKRALMGAVADRLAEVIVLTNDNPRSESPQAIIDDIIAGISVHANVTIEPDRAAAIRQALDAAGPEDWVVIAGKGHERTQEIAGTFLPFSDVDTVRQWIDGGAT